MAAKIQKLEHQFSSDKSGLPAKDSLIFAGISIFVNGYTGKLLTETWRLPFFVKFWSTMCALDPTSDVLKRLMQQHGGVFHHYYSRSKVSHIIATNLPNSKIQNITDKKVVHPRWITERFSNFDTNRN